MYLFAILMVNCSIKLVTPPTLRIDPSIICFQDTHFMYIGISLVGIGIYYPLSTFLFPGL